MVYFGESVPAERKARKDAMLAECSALLVVGSSVAVMSSYKIVLEALRAGKPVAVINGGPGRADAKAPTCGAAAWVRHWNSCSTPLTFKVAGSVAGNVAEV